MTKSPVIIDFSLENDGLGSCVRHEHMLSKDFRLQKKLLRNIPRSLVASAHAWPGNGMRAERGFGELMASEFGHGKTAMPES